MMHRMRRVSVLFAALWLAMTMFTSPGASAQEAGRSKRVTFNNQVVRILQRSCQNCHRPGQLAPISFLTYDEVRPWAKSIKVRVIKREMPPWHVDPAIGEYVNDPSLTEEEIATIVKWVDTGAREGDPKELPEPIEWPEGWTIGEPDLVLQIDRPHRVPAHGRDQFEYFSINTNLKEDRYIRAVELRPGDPRVVHHVLAYIHQNDHYDFRDEASFEDSIGNGGTMLTEFAVGNNGDVFPPGTGRLLKRGARIWLQIHYHSYGEATTDQTQIGLQFHPKGEEHQRIISRWIGERSLNIPPHKKDVRSYGRYTFRRPVHIVSFQPHMHCRGQAMRATAQYPDGHKEVIFSSPNFDFNWQTTYTYKAPPLLPAGTTLLVEALHDNTRGNPNNPDPSAYVRWGQQTYDEMMHLWTDFVYADEGFPPPVTDTWARMGPNKERPEIAEAPPAAPSVTPPAPERTRLAIATRPPLPKPTATSAAPVLAPRESAPLPVSNPPEDEPQQPFNPWLVGLLTVAGGGLLLTIGFYFRQRRSSL